MKISLIGMSGIGKTSWSKKLEKKGFFRLCCDDIIEQELKHELKLLGFSGINGMAKWMGQPYEKQYPQTSKKYLYLEKEALKSILNQIKNIQAPVNLVLDLTGSAIYTGNEIMRTLSRLTKIIYLVTSDDDVKKMYDQYLEDPKPVIWGNVFKKMNGENNQEALKRCYSKLLEYRAKKYEEYAHIKVDYSKLRDPNFSINEFLEVISK